MPIPGNPKGHNPSGAKASHGVGKWLRRGRPGLMGLSLECKAPCPWGDQSRAISTVPGKGCPNQGPISIISKISLIIVIVLKKIGHKTHMCVVSMWHWHMGSGCPCVRPTCTQRLILRSYNQDKHNIFAGAFGSPNPCAGIPNGSRSK